MSEEGPIPQGTPIIRDISAEGWRIIGFLALVLAVVFFATRDDSSACDTRPYSAECDREIAEQQEDYRYEY